NSSLPFSNVQAVNEGNYRVVVSNALGSATSDPARLTLLINPGFVVRPLDQFVFSNGSFSVCDVITGAPPPFRYEWREGSSVRLLTKHLPAHEFLQLRPVHQCGAPAVACGRDQRRFSGAGHQHDLQCHRPGRCGWRRSARHLGDTIRTESGERFGSRCGQGRGWFVELAGVPGWDRSHGPGELPED